ncbi:putative proteasome endopeptidase complex [Helianthus annuus]|nr:putative proteasome endopeptidase complex [Helianthus annuus]
MTCLRLLFSSMKLTLYDAHSGGEPEIQRTMLELLNQLDGFDSRGDVKVILATNKIESLDPALLCPGRIDRMIEFPLPDIKTRRRIFQVHCHRLTVMSYIYSLNLADKNHKMPILAVIIIAG